MNGSPGETPREAVTEEEKERIREKAREAWVDYEIQGSFPASDPPSWTCGIEPAVAERLVDRPLTFAPACEDAAGLRQMRCATNITEAGESGISTAVARAGADHAQETPAYEQWNRKELYDEARRLGVKGRSKMTKAQLIAAMRGS